MTNLTERHFVARGLKLTALTWGDRRDKPLLALHGWMDNALSFSELAPHIRNRHIIALDFAGHGHSGHRSDDAHYYVTEYALDVAHVLAQLSDQPIDLLGHSLGAGVACLIAGATPRVRRLVLLDGAGPLSGTPDRSPDDLDKAIEQSLSWPQAIKAPAKPRTLDSLRKRRQIASPEIAPAVLEAMVKRNAELSGESWGWRTDPRLKHTSPLRYSEEAVHEFLGRINCPVLYFHANQGLFKDNEMIEKRLGVIGDLTRHSIDGAHHVHMGEQAVAMAAQINVFLDADNTRP